MATTAFSPVNVGTLPGTIRPALFEIDEHGRVVVLARFESPAAAERFLSYGPRVEQVKIARA